ncbi:MAG: chorismate synthase [Clostridia bacterium]|nr:chorismate synthase [Clostridia bacterium]
MKNSIGSSVILTLFGESHGRAVGAVLDGMAPGIAVDEEFIAHQMELRRSVAALSTPRRESDRVQILSGVYEGKTTGTPITFVIENEQQRSADYKKSSSVARPAHADYTSFVKYHGYADPNGGGHFSGRITAGIVAAGAIALTALAAKGITVGSHIASLAGISDRPFSIDPQSEIKALSSKAFAVLDDSAAEAMTVKILEAKEAGDSVGGVLESAVCGLPAGVGEPWFDGLESVLARAIFGIPAVKGVEFGSGFALAGMNGSAANDPFLVKDGKILTDTNHAGGILGGISNGMPLIVRTAIKPTPSIFKAQRSVDLERGENAELRLVGRHDPAIVHRARVVLDSMIAIVLCDQLCLRFGTDYLMP